MSLWGYTTGRDLTGFGSFLMMGVFGLIIAMFANVFFQSSAVNFAVSVLGVLIFTGLTAYDTQKIKNYYYVGDDGSVAGKKAIMARCRSISTSSTSSCSCCASWATGADRTDWQAKARSRDRAFLLASTALPVPQVMEQS